MTKRVLIPYTDFEDRIYPLDVFDRHAVPKIFMEVDSEKLPPILEGYRLELDLLEDAIGCFAKGYLDDFFQEGTTEEIERAKIEKTKEFIKILEDLSQKEGKCLMGTAPIGTRPHLVVVEYKQMAVFTVASKTAEEARQFVLQGFHAGKNHENIQSIDIEEPVPVKIHAGTTSTEFPKGE